MADDHSHRLVAVQHGDYVEGLRIAQGSEPQPYSAMRYSVLGQEALHRGVVLNDVPAGATAVGVPARVLSDAISMTDRT